MQCLQNVSGVVVGPDRVKEGREIAFIMQLRAYILKARNNSYVDLVSSLLVTVSSYGFC